ncbi:hypothetical protein GCM10017559_45200 [Streptosporangium longisporum]|uniref:Secreted protein n=1 Tax=Streptosporangium longisporum TaxID=46187 RepID=A0ABP6KLM9_9ACTN
MAGHGVGAGVVVIGLVVTWVFFLAFLCTPGAWRSPDENRRIAQAEKERERARWLERRRPLGGSVQRYTIGVHCVTGVTSEVFHGTWDEVSAHAARRSEPSGAEVYVIARGPTGRR